MKPETRYMDVWLSVVVLMTGKIIVKAVHHTRPVCACWDSLATFSADPPSFCIYVKKKKPYGLQFEIVGSVIFLHSCSKIRA